MSLKLLLVCNLQHVSDTHLFSITVTSFFIKHISVQIPCIGGQTAQTETLLCYSEVHIYIRFVAVNSDNKLKFMQKAQSVL